MSRDPQVSRDDRLELAKELRAKLLIRLKAIEGPFWKRLSKCGTPITLKCGGCKELWHVASRCKWKCCPVCQRAVTAASAKRFSKIAAGCQWPLLVTFNATHKKSDGVLAFRQMRAALVRLREQVWWKRRVRGGVACWEVSRLSSKERRRKKLGADKGWHFHCHMLVDCKWLYATTPPPRQGASKEERASRIKAINEEIAELWSMAMAGRKGSIDVRRVWRSETGGIEGAVHEVCKYAMTGADLAASEYNIEPVLWALEKTRMVAGFGTFFRHPGIKREQSAGSMCGCGCSDWKLDRAVSDARSAARDWTGPDLSKRRALLP